jgi:hypothetical protein
MSPIPGQRSVQQPYQAATATYRALGKAAQSAAGGMAGAIGVGFVNGQQWEIDLSAPPGQQAKPVDHHPSTGEGDTHERQG